MFNLFLTGRGLSEQQLGMIGSAISAGSLIGAVPSAIIVRRIGLRQTFMGCQFLLPVILCARIFANSEAIHVALSLCAGLVFTTWAVSLSPMTAALVQADRRPRAFSLLFSVGIGLGALGGIAASRMPQLLQNFGIVTGAGAAMKGTLICAVALAALSLLFSLGLPDADREDTDQRVERTYLPGNRLFFLALAGWAFVTGSFSPFAGVYFTKHLNMALPAFGNVFFFCQTAQVLTVLAAPNLARRLGTRTVLMASQFLVALCLLMVALSHDASLSAAAYVIQTAGQWMIEPVFYAALMTMTSPELRGTVSATLAFVIGGAQLVSAALSGWAFTHLGYRHSLGVIAVVAVLSGALLNLGVLSAVPTSSLPTPLPADAD